MQIIGGMGKSWMGTKIFQMEACKKSPKFVFSLFQIISNMVTDLIPGKAIFPVKLDVKDVYNFNPTVDGSVL